MVHSEVKGVLTYSLGMHNYKVAICKHVTQQEITMSIRWQYWHILVI